MDFLEWYDRLFERDLTARAVGLVFLAAGLALGAFLLHDPLSAVAAHQRVIVLRLGAVAGPAIFVFMGLVYAVAGRHGLEYLPRRADRFTPVQVATIVAALVFCLGLEFGFQGYLVSRGYAVRGPLSALGRR